MQLSLYVDHFLQMDLATVGGPEQKQALGDVWRLWFPSGIHEWLNKAQLIWNFSFVIIKPS